MPRPITPGLCSVTFRALAPDEIVALCEETGLGAIEWGADVHLPPGKRADAEALGRRCAAAGIACPSYGSYWFAGQSGSDELEPVLDSAEALGAGRVRVWARFGVESDAPETDKAPIVEALAGAVERAEARGLALALEYHPGTLTHLAPSALALLAAVGSDALSCYWQPDARWSHEDARADHRAVREHVSNLHVFAWRGAPPERLALAEHEALWRAVLGVHAEVHDAPSAAYLEFVRDDAPERLGEDAATLKRWIEELPT